MSRPRPAVAAGGSGTGASTPQPLGLSGFPITGGPVLLPGHTSESKRDRKRRETINKIELLHDEAWRTRDEKFSQLYKDYHNENQTVNVQPPTSAQYLLRVYPRALERDALREQTEIDYQYKKAQAAKAYEEERQTIEQQYWEARDQVRQRLLGAIEERRRKLREEKEGGDVISDSLLDLAKPRPTKRMPFKNRIPAPPPGFHVIAEDTSNGASSTAPAPAQAQANGHSTAEPPSASTSSTTPNGVSTSTSAPALASTSTSAPNPAPPTDLLLHSHLAPALARIDITSILSPSSSSLILIPPTHVPLAPSTKRGPRGKAGAANANSSAGAGAGGAGGEGKDETAPAPGTLTALAIASGQQAPRGTRNAGASTQWVLGKSLADLKKMEMASPLEIESDWARMQGTGARGRRARGD